MNLKDTAKSLRAEAKRLEDQVKKLREAAAILDPPPKRDRAAKARAALAAKRAEAKTQTSPALPNGEPTSPVKLDLGTAGRTSHPSDPDARALRERLVHTTGGEAA
jgi:septal ring factor EnvC (AmiA/AmiB activator)